MKLENKKVSELEDEKVYVFKNNGATSQMKGITIKGVFTNPEQELLVSEVEERKDPIPNYYDRVKQMMRKHR